MIIRTVSEFRDGLGALDASLERPFPWTRSRLLSSTMLFLLIFLCLPACAPSGVWRIVNNENPPALKIEGKEDIKFVWVFGPYRMDPKVKEEARLVWKITPERYQPMSEIQPITYGSVPVGWTQQFPEQGDPEPLFNGKWYVVDAIDSRNRSVSICLKVDGDQISRYADPEGCSRK